MPSGMLLSRAFLKASGVVMPDTATNAPSRAAQRKNAANTGEKPRGRSGKRKPGADLYTEVTTKIVKELEAGRFPWAQPWAARGEAGGALGWDLGGGDGTQFVVAGHGLA